MGRPRVPLLNRDLIRDTALELIDRDGLAELSMRKLAAELGVQASSLYKHYPTKDDVLDAVASQVAGEIDTSGFDRGDDWQDALAAADPGLAATLHSRFAPRQLLFAHAALSDLRARQHRHAQRVARWLPGAVGVVAALLPMRRVARLSIVDGLRAVA